MRTTKYKVVTNNLKSLGLRRNPNILKYEIGRTKRLPKTKLLAGNTDWGGIWVTQNLSNAKTLQKYMQKKYNRHTRIFEVQIGKILYENSYRCKTNSIKLLREV